MERRRVVPGSNKVDREEKIKNKYRALAAGGTGGLFRYLTGEEGLRKLGYPAHILSALPEEVKAYFCGVGNPIQEVSLPAGVRRGGWRDHSRQGLRARMRGGGSRPSLRDDGGLHVDLSTNQITDCTE